VVLAHVSGGQFHGVTWDGSGAPVSVVVADVANAPIDLTALGNAEGIAAYGMGSGVGLARYTAAGWELMDLQFQDQVAGDISLLTDGDDLHVALTGSGQVYHGVLDSNGAVTRRMERLTGNNPGRYGDLQLSGSGDAVQLFTSYQSNIPQEVRDFTLPCPGEVLVRDSDGDGLDDIRELLIIDANSDDDLKRVSHVTAQDDFDGDGRSNGDEIAMGTDPAVADNPQDVGGDRPSDRWLAENAPGKDWLDLAPSGRTYLEVYATSGQPTEVAATDDGTIQFSYTKPSDANVNYVLEVGDGEIWSAVNGNEVSRLANGDGSETVTVQVPGEAPLARLSLILLP